MVAKSYDLEFDGYWRERNVAGIPAKSGIYGVYGATYNPDKDNVSLNRLLYIGEAGDVRDRLKNHEKWEKWRRQLRTGEELCFSVAPIAPAADRERCEAAMIYAHKPPCNDEYVNNFPFDQTTITTRGCNALMRPQFTVYSTQEIGLSSAFYGLDSARR